MQLIWKSKASQQALIEQVFSVRKQMRLINTMIIVICGYVADYGNDNDARKSYSSSNGGAS
jgi:hypothetical protein